MTKEKHRLWLMFPQKLVTEPIIWQLGHKYQVVTNIRTASINEGIGIVSLEIEGVRAEVKQAIHWLEELGVKVEPVEINTIEG